MLGFFILSSVVVQCGELGYCGPGQLVLRLPARVIGVNAAVVLFGELMGDEDTFPE